MKYGLKYVAIEYAHGWSVWLQRDDRKFMIGSAIKSEKELYNLLGEIKLEEKTPYVSRETIDTLKNEIKELQKYKNKYETLVKGISKLT